MSTDDHTHDFGTPTERSVRMCSVDDCFVLHACVKGAWVPLTPEQQTAATILMWEDLIMVDALSMIHGRARAVDHYSRMVGYKPK